MPENLRALVVILLMSMVFFAFAKQASAQAVLPDDFARRRNLWLAVTLVAFLSFNFWLYIILTGLLLLSRVGKEHNKVSLYFFLLFAVPAIQTGIPGLGIANYIFDMHYLRLLALTILFPTALDLFRKSETTSFGKTAADKLLASYILFNVFLVFLSGSYTSTLRELIVDLIDVVLLYYVVSRSLRTIKDFRDALMSFVLAALLVALFAVFETSKSWNLYQPLEVSLGVPWVIQSLLRANSLRAQVSTGQAIALGYSMAVALGFYLYLQRFIPGIVQRGLGMTVLIAGLIASYSRGPWLGAIAMGAAFIFLGSKPVGRLFKVGLIVSVVVGLSLATPIGEKVIGLLPGVGSEEAATVTYRQELLQVFIPIILDNPVLGTANFRHPTYSMEMLRQGQGIIDIVNTYLLIGLQSGLVGLGLFVGFFATIGFGILSAMRRISNKTDERHILGQALFATLICALITIFTVSSIAIIPYIYWCLAGLGEAYRMMMLQADTTNAPARPSDGNAHARVMGLSGS